MMKKLMSNNSVAIQPRPVVPRRPASNLFLKLKAVAGSSSGSTHLLLFIRKE